MAYSKSNGHVIDDFSSSRDLRDVKVVTQYVLGSSLLPCSYQTACGNMCPFLIPYPFLSLLSSPLLLSSPYHFSSCPFLLRNYSFLPIPSFPTPYLHSFSSILPYLFSFPLPSHLPYHFLFRYPFLPPLLIFSSLPLLPCPFLTHLLLNSKLNSSLLPSSFLLYYSFSHHLPLLPPLHSLLSYSFLSSLLFSLPCPSHPP